MSETLHRDIAAAWDQDRLKRNIASRQSDAAVNWDNYRSARDEWGDDDGRRSYRLDLWSDLAAQAYTDAREYLDVLLVTGH